MPCWAVLGCECMYVYMQELPPPTMAHTIHFPEMMQELRENRPDAGKKKTTGEGLSSQLGWVGMGCSWCGGAEVR